MHEVVIKNGRVHVYLDDYVANLSTREAEHIFLQLAAVLPTIPDSVRKAWMTRTAVTGKVIELFTARGEEVVTAGYKIEVYTAGRKFGETTVLPQGWQAVNAATNEWGDSLEIKESCKDLVSYKMAQKKTIERKVQRVMQEQGISFKEMLAGVQSGSIEL